MTDGPANPFRDDPFAPPQTVGRSVRAVPLLNLVALIVQLGGLAMMGRDVFAAAVGAGSRGELTAMIFDTVGYLSSLLVIVVLLVLVTLIAIVGVAVIEDVYRRALLWSIRKRTT